jgi:hypothetical protein
MKRWGKNNCDDCYNYTPHAHLERLKRSPPKTEDGQFIFFPSAGEWAEMPKMVKLKAIWYMEHYQSRMFLCQSKDPRNAFYGLNFPANAILGITLETNREVGRLSKAPSPFWRWRDFVDLKVNNLKMVTVEPILVFDLDILSEHILTINPWRVYIGYDSHPNENKLPEPPLAKTEELVKILRENEIDVRTKLMRERYES